MAEYIEREAFLEQKREQYCKDCDRRKGMKNGKFKTLYEIGDAPCRACEIDDVLNDVEDFPAANVVEQKTCKNVAIEYDDCDQFVCSECGIELQGWYRVEHDEDDGDDTYHEYRLRYCPNCGAKMIGDEDENQ